MKVFLAVVVLLLGITSLAKFLSIAHGAKLLEMPDPVFTFWTVRQAVLVAGVLETTIILLVCLPIKLTYKLWFVLWMCMIFWVYRMGLRHVGFNGYCPCFGTATEWLHLSGHAVDGAIKAVLWLMTGGSSLLLLADFFVDHISHRLATDLLSAGTGSNRS